MRTRYDRQATQKRILSTCVRLFLEQGFFNTPPKQIFAEADVSAGTFYHLYSSKSDVLTELLPFMFDNQFSMAGNFVTEGASPVLLYALETSIQLTLTELNENLREIYVEVYTQPETLEIIRQKTSQKLIHIFHNYLPEFSESDFYELDIGTSGLMRAYMARSCDVYFTLERKLSSFVTTTLRIFRVPEEEISQVIATIQALDIRAVASGVMEKLFAALEMQYDFSLSHKEGTL